MITGVMVLAIWILIDTVFLSRGEILENSFIQLIRPIALLIAKKVLWICVMDALNCRYFCFAHTRHFAPPFVYYV